MVDPRPRSQLILLCGYDDLAALTLQTLLQFGQTVMVVDPDLPAELPTGAQGIRGDYFQPAVLQQAGIEQARSVLLLKSDDQGNFKAALLMRELNPQMRIISRLFNQNLARYFDLNIPNHFSLSTSGLVAPAFALKAVSDEFLGYFALPPLVDSQASAQAIRSEATIWNVVDLRIGSGSRLIRMALEELEEQFQARVLFHYPLDQLSDFSRFRVFDDFDHRAQLGPGDRIVLICRPQAYVQLLQRNGEGLSRAQLWAAGQGENKETSDPFFQFGLMGIQRAWETLRHWPERVNALSRFLMMTLGGMVILGIANFLLLGKSPSDALFLTVTVLTGGYGDITDFQDPATPALTKLVAVLLTLVGAALIGFIYGSVTDKLLSSRIGLGKAGSIPRSGHIVVAGLGHVGFRITQLLRQMGYEVVAVEADEDNPFIQAARQEGIPVMVGNSALPSTLQRVNINSARCLVGATDNDLANLETALTATSLSDRLKTVLRVLDPVLADRIQKYFQHIGSSYSLTRLAAPAFATAALVGSVYGTMVWENQTLLLTSLTLGSRSPFLGQTLSWVVEAYDLLPLIVHPVGKTPQFFPKFRDHREEVRLHQGDRVFILATPAALSRLAQRRPLPQEAYRVKLISMLNAYFTQEIVSAIAFYSRQTAATVEPLLQSLPAIVSPQLPKEKALKLARQLRKMSTEVAVVGEIASNPNTDFYPDPLPPSKEAP